MTVGDRIKNLRKEKGISRAKMAEKLKMPYTTLRNYEDGSREPGHDFLIKYSKEFNVTTDYLLGLSENEKATDSNIDGKYLLDLIEQKIGREPTVKDMRLLSTIFDGICEYINSNNE